VLQLKLHCPGITIEDVRKSDFLVQLSDVMSDGVSQDLWKLSVGIDNNPWDQYQLEDRRNVGESSCNFGDGTDRIKGSNP